MANNCPYGVHGKHPRGVSGCGCDNDPARKAAVKLRGKSGGKNPVKVKGHKHDYSLDGPVSKVYDPREKEWVEYWPVKCLNNEDGKCPMPKTIEVHRRPGPPPKG